MSIIASHLPFYILETVREREMLGSKGPPLGNAYGESNDHVTDDVTWLWQVKLVTPIRLERNISNTAGDRGSVAKDHQYEMAYGESNGHVTSSKGQTRDPNSLWGHYLENTWRCYFSNMR